MFEITSSQYNVELYKAEPFFIPSSLFKSFADVPDALMIISDNTKITLKKIGKAVEKGAIEDMREYLQNCDTITKNGMPGVRSDKINTNLKNMVTSDTVEVKLFKRSSWMGILVIDKESKMFFSVCTKNTLNRIQKNKTRKSPHYAQTMVNTVNKGEIASVKQMSMVEIDPRFVTVFSDEDFEKDFFSIMEEAVQEYDDYRFWIVSYEIEHFALKSLSAVLMDKDFDRVQEISLLEDLKPNFGDLTAAEPKNEKNEDVRSFLSVKEDLALSKSSEPEKHTELQPKFVEESKEA